MNFKINWDALGIATSVACAIHCALLPLLLQSLSLFGVEIIHNELFEYAMIGVAALIGAYALWHGWRRHHHRYAPLLIFVAGIAFLVLKQAFHNYTLAFLVPAVVCIVWAHWFNYRLCRKANHCHAHDCAH
jgi:hypothetical protein